MSDILGVFREETFETRLWSGSAPLKIYDSVQQPAIICQADANFVSLLISRKRMHELYTLLSSAGNLGSPLAGELLRVIQTSIEDESNVKSV